MREYRRIVSFGAHPLDAELMGGPLMMRHVVRGATATFVHITRGRLTDPAASDEEKCAYDRRLTREMDAAASGMGCNQVSFGYTSATLPSPSALAKQIEDYLVQENVDCVITHARGTLHPRHYSTWEAVTMAVRSMRRNGHDIQLYYGENCEDLAGFTPTLYISQTQEEFDAWFKALSNYAIFCGAINNVPYREYYHALALVRSIEAGGTGFMKAYMHAPLIDNE